MKYKRSVIMVMLIAVCLCLTGCFEPDPNYVPDIYELTSGQEALVTAPSADYVVTALSKLDSIIGIEIDSDIESTDFSANNDNAPKGIVYFRSANCSQETFKESKSIEDNSQTLYGGCIKIFDTFEQAAEEDREQSWGDNRKFLYGGGHSIVGTLVIQTSSSLDIDEHDELTEKIVEELVSGTIDSSAIDKAMAKYFLQFDLVRMPRDSEDYFGKDYHEVVDELRSIGFADVSTREKGVDFETGEWEEGETCSIYILKEKRKDDLKSWEKGDTFALDSIIMVEYAVNGYASVPASSEQLVGIPYEEAVKLFEDAGFSRIELDSIHPGKYVDPSVQVGDVVYVQVGFKDSDQFNVGDRKPSDTVISICYSLGTEGDRAYVGNTDEIVWISDSGSRYHTNPYCSSINNPTEVTIEQAISWGYTPCKRCH